ncbi:EAL domain-containing protein [Stappia taiwanensis]|uniref:EAL domain-containing protein n=1 Tax=Stappia taiwanensis TaxID=992267 RepID=A0A838XRJ7_9HYPH|nr:EAL domain-containing protein [Stappia taiwanensis]MBA4611298.1 EAL domain-containing protein [Stappia taiwanensis]GGE87579.1 diguanylate cyclase [Stappia taiwanensis]
MSRTGMIDWFRHIAIGVICLLGIAIVVHSDTVSTSSETVERSMRYDIAVTAFTGRIDVLQARERLARFIVTRSPADAQGATLSYQILLGRLETWTSGGFGEFVNEAKDRRAVLIRLKDEIYELDDEYETLSDPEAVAEIQETLDEAVAIMDRIGGQAHMANLAEAEEIRETLREKQHLQNTLVEALIGVGAALLVFTTFQSRSLRRAHEEAQNNARKFEFLAQHDSLTGLPNRLAFTQVLTRTDCQPQDGRQIAVLAIDLDGFKAVNDMLGHAAGDDLLVSVARRLQRIVDDWGEGNLVSRVGGDEFIALLTVEGGQAEAMDKAQQMVTVLRRPHEVVGGNVVVNATIGLALAEECGPDAREALLRDADLALGHAKARGKGRVHTYDPSMRAAIMRRRQIEADFPAALVRGEIRPYYQPQIEMQTGRTTGIEALARWHHADLGWISPAEFIPIAEASGRIIEVGRTVLESACRDAVRLGDGLAVSVNLSVAQLVREDMVETVRAVLSETGLAATRLKLEVTESVVMTDTERAVSALRRLREIGVSIALDDFGTGYSALSYLRKFEWDELKIDRSFVKSLDTDLHSLSIIEAIVSLARQLRIAVLVEGVETQEQFTLLSKAGCRTAQGFLFSRAVSVEELPELMKRCLEDAPNWRRGEALPAETV